MDKLIKRIKDSEYIKGRLNHGVDVNSEFESKSLLLWAIQMDALDTAALLIGWQGVDLNPVRFGSALDAAFSFNRVEVAVLLIKAGAKTKDSIGPLTSLFRKRGWTLEQRKRVLEASVAGHWPELFHLYTFPSKDREFEQLFIGERERVRRFLSELLQEVLSVRGVAAIVIGLVV